MLKQINQCDIYVGLWCIYMLQDVLYPSGIINLLLQLVMMLLSMIALFKYIYESRIYEYSSILKATFLLIVMYAIYGSIHIMFDAPINGQNTYYYLQSALNSLAPIFLFYHFTMNGKLTSDRIKIYLPFFIVTCILLYYKNERLQLYATSAEEITNNMGYMFVTLIPLLFFLYKKPLIQFLLIGIILFYVFMGIKRGAILIGVLGTMVLLYTNIKSSFSRWSKFLFTLLTITIIVGISLYIDYMMNNSAYFMARVEQTMEGNTSGRDAIYKNLWNTIRLESNPFYFYLGRGADSTLKITGKFAHQDWLETFCNNGLVGVLILFYFLYTLGKTAWQSRKYFPQMMFYSFITLVFIIFSKTLFSMSIQNLDLPIALLLGYFSYWVIHEDDDLEIYEFAQDE